ncbi:hypothetical protein GH714_028267 [Hevea brasiliensis]|uniref:Methyltransferase n=1 Tax=Hevea brasiliensis TaxID=3981 RepID=A0A6A6LBL5_HEVBR|nr:hypothetical protein GH714_028267 [Hevea brasiliensis]
MALKTNSADGRTRSSIQIFIVVGLCCFFYILGAWQRSGFGKADNLAMEITKNTGDCNLIPSLNFETHHGGEIETLNDSESKPKEFKPCDPGYTDYTPCQDQRRAMTFPRENMIYRERHCPMEEEKLHCLIPAPKGYVTPFPWLRVVTMYRLLMHHKSLTVEKAIQNWEYGKGNVFRFPGGGTQFPQGADKYIDQLASVIPIANGTVRTALDTGCGVASWGAYLWSRNVIAMSFAPRDSHEAQTWWLLGAFGPPINWKNSYKAWQRPKEELQEEQRKIEEVAKLLCWDKKYEKGEMAIWQKRVNAKSCPGRRDDSQVTLCQAADPNDVWYKKMEGCITSYPDVSSRDEVAGGELKAFPDRLFSVPPTVASGFVPGVSVETYQETTIIGKSM